MSNKPPNGTGSSSFEKTTEHPDGGRETIKATGWPSLLLAINSIIVSTLAALAAIGFSQIN